MKTSKDAHKSCMAVFPVIAAAECWGEVGPMRVINHKMYCQLTPGHKKKWR